MRKLNKPVGPFRSQATTFNKGKERALIVTLEPKVIKVRALGIGGEFSIPIESIYLKGIAMAADFDASARTSTRIKRGI